MFEDHALEKQISIKLYMIMSTFSGLSVELNDGLSRHFSISFRRKRQKRFFGLFWGVFFFGGVLFAFIFS